eukprot:m.188919 g.188919  ORF g.188919 m.188919 type:complete len:375 (-) comp17541_c0_seq1:3364-4488(-)
MALKGVFCPNHRTAPVIEDFRAGDLICSQCGLVVGDRVVDVGTEWRTFSNSEKRDFTSDPNRVGQAENPLLFGSSGLCTELTTLPGERERQHGRSTSSLKSADRSLILAYKEIDRVGSTLALSTNTAQRAKKLFKETVTTAQLRGRSHDAICAACIFIACRQENVSRTFKEICGASGLDQRTITRCYKKIVRVLDVSAKSANPTVEDFVPRFCNKLELPRHVEVAARHVAQNIKKVGVLEGKAYTSVVGAIIFLVSQLSEAPKSLEAVMDVSGASSQAIRNSYREIRDIAAYLMPKDFPFHEKFAKLPDFGSATETNAMDRCIAAGLVPVADDLVTKGGKSSAKRAKTTSTASASASASAAPSPAASASIKSEM